MLRLHVQILKVYPRPAEKRREIIEEKREADLPAVLKDKYDLGFPLIEYPLLKRFLGRDNLVKKSLIIGGLTDESEYQRDILPRGVSEIRSVNCIFS